MWLSFRACWREELLTWISVRAHEDDVTHIPKKKQRKALGKMVSNCFL